MTITSVLTFSTYRSSVLIYARGPSFDAIITTVVLTAVLALQSLPLLIWQLGVFALGAFLSPQKTPYAFLYKKLVRPRLKGDVPTEDVRPPQFAQIVGFLFALGGTIALLLGNALVATIIIGFALAAAFLNAAFNFCLGCEMYLLIARFRGALKQRTNAEDSYNLPSL
jgi:hypothetical protein